MSTSTFDILPESIKGPLGAIAKQMGCEPDTAVAAWLAFDEIKRLPDDQQVKAIAIIVSLRDLRNRVAS